MKITPYITLMRLDKPIGIWLLFFPAAWAVGFAGGTDTGQLMLLMLLGSFLTRAAGCILNDLTDRKLDAQVERTRNRPLASGDITPIKAIILLFLLLLGAFLIVLMLPKGIFLLALLALPMIAAYPWMKRITWWPQLFLGLTFNLGTLFGWVAAGQPLVLPAGLIYAAAICWTLGYDTIYAVQDMADDAKIGIRSSARRVGLKRLRVFVTICYASMLMLLTAAGILLGAGTAYYCGLLLALTHAFWQVTQLPCAPERAGALFRSNQWLGLFILIGLLADRLL